MTANESDILKENISKGIMAQLEKHDMTQKELSEVLGVEKSTVGKWINKTSIPRMGVIQKMADYFGVGKSYFLEGNNNNNYYLNEETRKIAQEAFENPELRMLFDASRNISPEDMKLVIEMVKRMKKKENHEED